MLVVINFFLYDVEYVVTRV